jgi:3alpha(or 20beta)-hydroxysteroid dehydrogenase
VLEDRGRELASELGHSAEFVRLDVGDEGSWAALVDAVASRHGRLDVLVNNAGIAEPNAELVSTTLEDFERALTVNVVGVFLGMKHCADLLSRSGSGAIVNIASTNGLRASRARIAYTATKFAVRGMTRVAALELAGRGIRVNAVLPGAVDTEMVKPPSGGRTASFDAYLQRVPLGRIGTPEELARLVLFLAGPDSAYCTGADFVADGGFLAT